MHCCCLVTVLRQLTFPSQLSFLAYLIQLEIYVVVFQTDMQVRDKVLVLLDSWQEAFGGPGGKHAHYYWAYEELKVCIRP